MKVKIQKWITALAMLAVIHQAAAQGTAFTYQGRLNNTGSPANGNYDFRFRLAAYPLGNTYVGHPFLTNGIAAITSPNGNLFF